MSVSSQLQGPDLAARDAAVHDLQSGKLLAVATLGRDRYALEMERRCESE